MIRWPWRVNEPLARERSHLAQATHLRSRALDRTAGRWRTEQRGRLCAAQPSGLGIAPIRAPPASRSRAAWQRKMTETLLLKRASASRPSGDWNDDYFDVLADGAVVGRILKVQAAPVGSPWMWTLAFGQHEDRTPTH